MSLTRIPSSGLTGNLTLGNVTITGSLLDSNGNPYSSGGASSGYTGSAGTNGYTGSAGTSGYTGSAGTDGYTGSQGDIGYTGSAGTNGYTGSAGTTGYTGSFGYTGSAGYLGSFGYTGSLGYTGSQGVGYTGSAGAQGVIGYTGSAGTGGEGGGGYTGSAGLPGTLASGVVTDTFTGNGVQTAFTLSVTPLNISQTIVNIDGITQQRSTYSLTNNILTLGEALLTDEVLEVTTLAYGTTTFTTRNYTGDGTTTVYTVTNGITADAVIVSINGVIQRPITDYTVSTTSLIFVEAPAAADIITVREIPAGTAGSAYSRSSQTATAGQTVFTVAYAIGYLQVYLNGVLLSTSDYTATNGSTVVLTDAAAVDDLLEFVAFNTVPLTQVPVATYNSTNLTSNLSIAAGYSAVSVGPISVADGVTISIASGQKWVIL